MRAGLPPEPGPRQRHPADGVTHQRHRQRGKTQSGEQSHEYHILLPGVVEHINEAPGARVLVGVRAQIEARQHGHEQSRQPDESQAELRAGFGDPGRVQQRPGDAQAALSSHGAAHEERAQAKEHHAAPQELTHLVRGGRVLGVRVSGDVEPQDQGPGNHMADEVRDHQRGGEQEERGFGAPALPRVRVDQDEEGHHVGDDAQRHGEHDDDDAAGGGLHQGEVPRRRQLLRGHAGLHLPRAVAGEAREERGGWGVFSGSELTSLSPGGVEVHG